MKQTKRFGGLAVRVSRHLLSLFLCAGLASTSWADGIGDDHKRVNESNGGWGLNEEVLENLRADGVIPQSFDGSGPTLQALQPCTGGQVMGMFPCRNIDVQAFIPRAMLGLRRPASQSVSLNDVWGWTDPASGREFALVGGSDRLVFVEVTDPVNPRVLGSLPSRVRQGTQPAVSIWRGVKVFGNYAYVVADRQGAHGMQVFDLRRLLTAPTNVNAVFTQNAALSFGQAHNIVMNEDTAFMYAVGTAGNADCGGGLLMINISNPLAPRRAGCYTGAGYIHDAQCVVYQGPDTTHRGKEICVTYDTDAITVVDVTNKTTPVAISRTTYATSRYVHQGWFLNDQQRIVIADDELDETPGGRTRTYIFNFTDLDRPRLIGTYRGPSEAIDHNLYTIPNPMGGGDIVIQSNYRAGVRILNTVGIAQGRMQEAAFFDMIPENDLAEFTGVWTTYAFFPSGNLVSTDLVNGLYILRPNYAEIRRLAMTTPATAAACTGGEERSLIAGLVETVCTEQAN